MTYLHPVYLLTHVFPLLIIAALILKGFGISVMRVLFAPFRLVKLLLVIALIGLAGCSHTEELAQAKGPLFALNPDHWQAGPDDLKDPPAVGH